MDIFIKLLLPVIVVYFLRKGKPFGGIFNFLFRFFVDCLLVIIGWLLLFVLI